MEVPKIFTKENTKYFLVEICESFARYQTKRGVCECFGFHELGLIEERETPRHAWKDGMIKV